MPNTTQASRARGPGAMLCPNCGGGSFSERSYFKTASEPLLGEPSSSVVVDLMACVRCGTDFPAVRGRRRYALLGEEKLSALLADLDEAKRINTEMQTLVSAREKKSQGLGLEIERSRARGEASAMEAKAEVLESETRSLEVRRDALARIVEDMASKMHARTA